MIVGSFGTCAGSWLKILGVGQDGFVWVFVGQTLVAFSQVFILGVPPHLAAQWFGPDELSTATAVGVFGNQVRSGTHPSSQNELFSRFIMFFIYIFLISSYSCDSLHIYFYTLKRE
jgi:hypothetical protein